MSAILVIIYYRGEQPRKNFHTKENKWPFGMFYAHEKKWRSKLPFELKQIRFERFKNEKKSRINLLKTTNYVLENCACNFYGSFILSKVHYNTLN